MSSALLLVGGGRWARVYLSALVRSAGVPNYIVVVSRHGGQLLSQALALASSTGAKEIALCPTLQHALDGYGAVGAIVANTARDHVATGVTLLEAGVPILLEKPVALDHAGASLLVRSARMSGVALVPGLILQFCSYLQNFATVVGTTIGPVRTIDIVWTDPVGESRYDEIKRFDAGIGVAEEIGSHIWTLLKIITGDPTCRMRQAEIEQGGLAVQFEGSSVEADITVTLQRQAATRRRVVSVTDHVGRAAILDFSSEPGMIKVGERQWDADSEWRQRARPLVQQIENFMRKADFPSVDDDLAAVEDSTTFIAGAADLVRRAQRSWLASPPARRSNPHDRKVALRELLAPALVTSGLLAPGDNITLEVMTDAAMRLIAGDTSALAPPELRRELVATALIT